ncbi:MAG: DNA internalization-related competence protein ComEC/Rec2 [Bacilli bacterium]|nr:DNA internalization-related competence protein ComEC/Rec2 [Bacilli bacterium]
MLRLKILLQSNNIYYILLIISLLLAFFKIYIIKYDSKYNINDNIIEGYITTIISSNDKITLEIKGKEKIRGYYFPKENLDLKLGMKIRVYGSLYLPEHNTIPNTFNYKKYLNNHRIFYLIKINKIEVLSENKNIILTFRNYLNKKITSYKYTSDYLNIFILGDKKEINENTYKDYQINGVVHLFAISGMHINLLAASLLFFFKKIKIKKNLQYLIIIIFLILFSLIINSSASVYRSLIFFIFLTINKLNDFNISIKNVLFLTAAVLIFLNPLIIFDLGFQYSIMTTYGLIISTKKNKKNYIVSLLYTSFMAFVFSLPITIMNFYEINLLSPINNLIFVPLVTLLIYPLSLITIIIPFFEPLFYILIKLMEIINSLLIHLNIFNIIIPKVNIIFILIYYILIITYIYSRNKNYLLMSLILICSFKMKPLLNNDIYVYYIDVKQGDSILIHNKKEDILIDTGGLYNYNISNTTIVFFKSLGIAKLNSLILTHGDFDHMGESINLVNNFKVKNVFFNCGEYNELEKDLIKILKNKNIKYHTCIKQLKAKKFELQFLNLKEYNNENDNSSVIYLNYNNYKFLFMGDASKEVEKDILQKHNIYDVDFLKVGHHGSKTSTSKEFINKINPKYSIISVGKNNRYGHPNDNVLDNLESSKIYRTDQDGSIMFKIKNNKLEIEACAP